MQIKKIATGEVNKNMHQLFFSFFIGMSLFSFVQTSQADSVLVDLLKKDEVQNPLIFSGRGIRDEETGFTLVLASDQKQHFSWHLALMEGESVQIGRSLNYADGQELTWWDEFHNQLYLERTHAWSSWVLSEKVKQNLLTAEVLSFHNQTGWNWAQAPLPVSQAYFSVFLLTVLVERDQDRALWSSSVRLFHEPYGGSGEIEEAIAEIPLELKMTDFFKSIKQVKEGSRWKNHQFTWKWLNEMRQRNYSRRKDKREEHFGFPYVPVSTTY